MISSKKNFVERYWKYLVFGFFFISIGSWGLEILYSLILRGKLVFPGTLSGPWCPIYGTAFFFLSLFLEKKDHPVYNFVKIFVIATIIEYISSYISGEIFHNVIWDYSDAFMNINGRVCLGMSLIFACLGYFMMYIIEPVLRRIYIRLGNKVEGIITLLITFFVFDILINIFFI